MQKKEEERFKAKNILISHYSVNVSGVVLKFSDIHMELNNIIKHFKAVLAVENVDNKLNLNGLKGDSEYYKMYYSDCFDKIAQEYIKDMFIYDINYPIITDRKSNLVLKYMDLNMKKKNLLKMLSLKNEKGEKESDQLEKIDIDIVKTQDKIKEANKKELEHIKDVIITFRNQKLANFYHNVYRKNKCDRCCYIFCCQFKKIKHL
jgi:hypothetical protein